MALIDFVNDLTGETEAANPATVTLVRKTVNDVTTYVEFASGVVVRVRASFAVTVAAINAAL